MSLTIPPDDIAKIKELVLAKYLKFTVNYASKPTIKATMGDGHPHYALHIQATAVDRPVQVSQNNKEELAFLTETHMMNSTLNQALEGLGDYGVYADVIRLCNGRRKAAELDKQQGLIIAIENFA
jgi:hypothetical protein